MWARVPVSSRDQQSDGSSEDSPSEEYDRPIYNTNANKATPAEPKKDDPFLKYMIGMHCLRSLGPDWFNRLVILLNILLSILTFFGPFLFPLLGCWSDLIIIGPRIRTMFVPFAYLVTVYFHAFYMAVTTEPGVPPTAEECKAQKLKLKQCAKCLYCRPERTHHCSVCGRCCLKYDHHCPWIGRCVGFYNQGYFLKFLLYGAVASFYSLLLSVIIYGGNMSYLGECSLWVIVAICVLTIAQIFSDTYTVSMFYSTTCILTRNITTLEDSFLPVDAARESLYDMGLRGNMHQVFGRALLPALLLPVRIVPVGDGMKFPKKYD